ncbi:MAG: hypothetical protein AAGA67_14080 [Cyanobacteria bacterium P01_F01_bin.153]
MNSYWDLGVIAAVWGIASGWGLKVTVPLMKNIQLKTAIALSASIPVMLIPSLLVHIWGYPLWWVVVIQGAIALIAAIISGYWLDTMLSYALLGILSLAIIYGATFVSPNLSVQTIATYATSFLVFTAANIYGHGFTESGTRFLLQTIGSTALSVLLCCLTTLQVVG